MNKTVAMTMTAVSLARPVTAVVITRADPMGAVMAVKAGNQQ